MTEWHNHFVLMLQEEFAKLRDKNPRFSLRAFSRMMGVSASTVFRLTSGDLKVSSDRALEMVAKLALPAEKMNDLIYRMNHPYVIPESVLKKARERLAEDNFEVKLTGNRELLVQYLSEIEALKYRLEQMSELLPKDLQISIRLTKRG